MCVVSLLNLSTPDIGSSRYSSSLVHSVWWSSVKVMLFRGPNEISMPWMEVSWWVFLTTLDSICKLFSSTYAFLMVGVSAAYSVQRHQLPTVYNNRISWSLHVGLTILLPKLFSQSAVFNGSWQRQTKIIEKEIETYNFAQESKYGTALLWILSGLEISQWHCLYN